MTKTAIAVFSDPSAGEEALGRVFNAMVLALELKERGEAVELAFQGAGSRWPAELVKEKHPAHALYRAVEPSIAGVCGACADVFGATEGAKATGLKLVRERAVPGTTGMLDLSRYLAEGYRLLVF